MSFYKILALYESFLQAQDLLQDVSAALDTCSIRFLRPQRNSTFRLQDIFHSDGE